MELVFSFIIALLIFAEYRLYKTFFNPFIIIAFLYLFLILVNNFIGVNLGFFSVSAQSMMLILYFLILVFLISVIFNFLMKKKSTRVIDNSDKYIKNVVFRNKKLIVTLFLIGLISKYISLYQAIKDYGLPNIKGKDNGIFAHFGDISVVLLPFILILFLQNKKRFYYLILIFLVYINLFVFGGKYEIFISFIHVIAFYSIIYNIKIRTTMIFGFLSIIVGLVVFVVIYTVKPILMLGYFDKSVFLDNLYFSFRHFFYYLESPVIATNFYFSNGSGEDTKILFTVPINIMKAIFQTGDYIDPVNSYFIPVSLELSTNVGGFFAESVYRSGLFFASMYVVIFFCLVYYVYIKSRYRGEMLNLSSLLLAIVSMMFFSNFLAVSGIVLLVIYLWMIEWVLKKKFVRN